MKTWVNCDSRTVWTVRTIDGARLFGPMPLGQHFFPIGLSSDSIQIQDCRRRLFASFLGALTTKSVCALFEHTPNLTSSGSSRLHNWENVVAR